jgi:hypothetical protein
MLTPHSTESSFAVHREGFFNTIDPLPKLDSEF